MLRRLLPRGASLLSRHAAQLPLARAPPSLLLLLRASPPAFGRPSFLSTESGAAAAAVEEEPRLNITDSCAKRIVKLNSKNDLDAPTQQRVLRLSVEPGGCSGFSYKFELEEASSMDEEEDVVFEKLGARVVVDSGSLELLSGATIDFEDDMMKSAFVVAANPQSSASCGCGTSFQVEI